MELYKDSKGEVAWASFTIGRMRYSLGIDAKWEWYNKSSRIHRFIHGGPLIFFRRDKSIPQEEAERIIAEAHQEREVEDE